MSRRGRGGGGRGRGRGEYYKQKYGGGGRGGGGQQQDQFQDYDEDYDMGSYQGGNVGSMNALCNIFRRINGRQYPAYKDIYGDWQFEDFLLKVDHIQGDAYASPSRFRIQVPHEVVGIPQQYWNSKIRRIALADFLTRTFGDAVSSAGGDIRRDAGGWQSAKGGDMTVDMPGQNVIERTSMMIMDEFIEARFTIGLPAKGRTVLGDWAEQIICVNLPKYVQKGLYFQRLDQQKLIRHVLQVEDQEYLRNLLDSMDLCCFVANGSILPRVSGDCDEPLSVDEAVVFQSPPSLQVQIQLPNQGMVQGMGIKKGITLIVGGGFHGKSTLLEAIEVGVYNKIPGDGRGVLVACIMKV
eukprot:TRINITY_DN1746_c0_g1_i1.p1 TRINITY_DN1746_c0_g1~~TRINITY_DN1746_c0_g1_i1.p1  ORF type:complete len:353 (-),score=67.14 TRINITY_DN1746_c0_g1_i1:111-1169(-)